MFNVLCLQAVGLLFGITNGLVVVALPQSAFLANASSEDLGFLGACSPLGYGVSCLLFGMLFAKQTGKRVLLWGLLGSIGVALWLAFSHHVAMLNLGMLLFGISAGAIWPFLSAWMFDFASPQLPRTFILRLYNIAWTGGVLVGCFLGGILLTHYCVPKEIYLIIAGLQFLALLLVLIPPATRHSLMEIPMTTEITHTRRHVAVSLLIAAVIANLSSLGVRMLAFVNYAELNKLHGFESDRMGYLIACTMGGQMMGFLFGFIYEPWLGLRRLYTAYAGVVIGICITFAVSQNMVLLMAAALLAGLTSAIAFQCGIFAATECLSTPRAGTTFHEAMVGLGGMAPVPAGILVGLMKENHSEYVALQSPFFAMAVLMGAGLLIQLWLVSRRAEGRLLLPKTVSNHLTSG